MNETVIRVIPAPSSLMYGYDGGTAQSVACLALVELADGGCEIRAMDLTNYEVFEGRTDTVLSFEQSCEKRMGEVKRVAFEMRLAEWGTTPSTKGHKFCHFFELPTAREFFKKKDHRCCNTERLRGKRKVDLPLF